MPTRLIGLADTGHARERVGGKAAVLGELAAHGWPVPPGFVVTADALTDTDLAQVLAETAERCGGGRFAVRSSGVAEDLPDASYAGLYETFLNVGVDGLADAVRRCFAAAQAGRVHSYHDRRAAGGEPSGMAVLVQVMVDARAAGVAFTAHPVTGARDQILVTAVAGIGDSLVAGEQTGEEWTITGDRRPQRTRRAPGGGDVLDEAQAGQVAAMAARVAAHYGQPQDLEWAIDTSGRLWLLQARPMTALPEPVTFAAPGPGLWMRNFRLGEWLPEAVTPLFGSWLLPELEAGFLDGMHECIGVRVPFRWALVHEWYYTATPIPSPWLLARVVIRGRGRAVRTLWHALGVGRDPVAADRAVLADLYRRWRDEQLPRYRDLVARAEAELPGVSSARVIQLASAVARQAGQYMWYLAIVGGSAWKIEASLARFCRHHLTETIRQAGGVQVLLRGLPATQPAAAAPHAVQSLDCYHPVAAELPAIPVDHSAVTSRHRQLAADREAAQAACRAALTPGRRAEFDALLEVAQRYAAIREEQSRDLTLGWPVLRACAASLGQHLTRQHVLATANDVHFCTRVQVDGAVAGQPEPLDEAAADRRAAWERHRKLTAPIMIGRPPRLVGDVIDRVVRAARSGQTADAAIVGHPASAGRATGPARLIHGPQDFEDFADGDVLVAKATSPAWTPLFARAAAVVTDGGTLAAHASLVAREYGIPAVVGTGTATSILHTGQIVTVDGGAGTVALAFAAERADAQP